MTPPVLRHRSRRMLALMAGLVLLAVLSAGGRSGSVAAQSAPHNITGFFEKLLAPSMFKKLYAEELSRLDRHARGEAV